MTAGPSETDPFARMTEEISDSPEPSLRTWSRAQALAIAATLGPCALWHTSVPVVFVAAASFLALIAASRRQFTPSGRFGFANGVTSLRLSLVLFLAVSCTWLGPRTATLLAALVLGLDALDGWLARSRGEASVFGAHFDMETDALFVLVLTLRLWLAQSYGAWVLTAGLLRYAYVLSLWFVPHTGREAPRSLLGRFAFLYLVLTLLAGLSIQNGYGTACVALGTLVVTSSFARSFYFSYAAS